MPIVLNRARGTLSDIQPVACRCGTTGSQGINPESTHVSLNRMRHVLPFGVVGDVVIGELGWFMATGGPTEVSAMNAPNGVKVVTGVSAIGGSGTGYVVGDLVTLPINTTTAPYDMRAAVLVVLAVSSGAPTLMGVIDGGCYLTVQTGTVTQASTTTTATISGGVVSFPAGAGTGATFTLSWGETGSAVFHTGFEPVWGTQTNIVPATQGISAAGKPIREILVPGGDVGISDPVQFQVAPGGAIGTRRYCAGMFQATQRLPLSGSEYFYQGNNANDYSNGTTISGTTVSPYGLNPFFIAGRLETPRPWFLLIGDSILAGAQDLTGDGDGNTGWVERGIASKFPWVGIERSSDKYVSWVSSSYGSAMRFRAISKIPGISNCIVIDQMGVNDLGTGNSAATTLANKKTIWAELMGYGVQEIWTCTLTLTTPSSTDGYTTIANQTVSNDDAARQTYNANIRSAVPAGTYASPYGVTRLLDVASMVEYGGISSPSGKWNVGVTAAPTPLGTICTPAAGTTNWTAEGIHPLQTITQNMMAPVLAEQLPFAQLRNAPVFP